MSTFCQGGCSYSLSIPLGTCSSGQQYFLDRGNLLALDQNSLENHLQDVLIHQGADL